jgi:hypothetical protein
MAQSAPTVDEVLARCEFRGWNETCPLGFEPAQRMLAWIINGGEIIVASDKLRQALEDAYDPTMPNWPAMVEIDNA